MQMTMNASGTPPDLWVPYATVGSRGYEAVGMVHDLTSFVRQDKFDMSGISKPVADFFTVDGHLVLQFPFPFQAAATVAVLGDRLVPAVPLAGEGGGPEESDQQAADFGDGDGDVAGTAGDVAPPF